MPRYSVDIKHEVSREEVLAMFDVLKKMRDRAIVAFLYLTGARPSEVVEISRDDFTIEPHKWTVKIPTKKKKGKDKFEVDYRVLEFPRPMPRDAIVEALLEYVEEIPEGKRVFPISTDYIYKMVVKASEEALGYRLVPYHFRHSRLTKIARAGASAFELKYFKGASDYRSIAPYLHARKQSIPPEWIE